MTYAQRRRLARLSERSILEGDYSAREVDAISQVLGYHPRYVRSVLKNGGASLVFAERLMVVTGAGLEVFLHPRDFYRQLLASRVAEASRKAGIANALRPSKPLRLVTGDAEVHHSSGEPVQQRARRYAQPGDWVPVVR